MAAALVQSSPTATQASATTITTTFPSAPTSNNLLIGNIHTRSSTLTNPTGFTTAISVLNGTNNDILRQAFKVSDGSETSQQWTGMEGSGADTIACAHEFSGMETSSVEDQEASAAFTSPGGTSRQVGPTSAASQNEVVYIAALGLRGAAISAESVNNGYTLVGNGDVAGSTHLLDAYKIVTDGAAGDVTFSWTTTSVNMGLIQGYKTAAGGGGSVASGALSATGTGTATFAGAALAASALNSAGTSTMSAVGAAIASGALNAEGVGMMEMVGASTGAASGDFSMSGEAGVDWVGQQVGGEVVEEVPPPDERGGPGASPGGDPWKRSSARRRKRLKGDDEELLEALRQVAPDIIIHYRKIH